MTPARHTFVIDGMHCTSCAMSIDWALEDVDGVVEARTSYANARTEVAYHPDRVTIEQLIDAIALAGFAARPNA